MIPTLDRAHLDELRRAGIDPRDQEAVDEHFAWLNACAEEESQNEVEAAYDRGRRDVLNAILALNPKAAQKLHIINGGTEETFENHQGQLPFDVVFWVCEVADQLGIQPRDQTITEDPTNANG